MTQDIISIIIPVLNEAGVIEKTLGQLIQYPALEIIVVDGGSTDNTVAIAQRTAKVKVITVIGKGRAGQMNAGAKLAQSNILLFLHADTQLPDNFVELIKDTLQQTRVIAGAFELAIDGAGQPLRLVELLVKVRSRLFSLPYGDQAIFVTQQAFIKLGGFADLPIMEDFEFVQRAKKTGRIAIAPGAVITSGRRWQKLGVWQTTLINQLIIAGYYCGISPAKLGQFYRHQGKRP